MVASKKVSPKAAPKRGRGKKVKAGNATIAVVERAELPLKRGRSCKELGHGMEMSVTVDDCKVKEAPEQKVISASNRIRKRAADASPESSPSNKRHSSSCGSAREGKAASLACSSPSLRGVTRHQVMFTGFISEKDSALVEELGGRLTEVVSECTVLVADSMKRTVKLLCMAGRGVPIVSSAWLKESRAAGLLLEPWSFLLTDREVEKKWGCKLGDTLRQASKSKLLTGWIS